MRYRAWARVATRARTTGGPVGPAGNERGGGWQGRGAEQSCGIGPACQKAGVHEESKLAATGRRKRAGTISTKVSRLLPQ
jgi:hypothetical protein